MATICPNQCAPIEPFDVVEAWVETSEGATVTEPREPTALDYKPTGYTRVIWDTQQTVGYGCPECGAVVLANEFTVAGITYRQVAN